MDLTDPIAFALDVAEVLRAEGLDHALYGGLLLAAYGEARETKDADLAFVRIDAGETSSLLARTLGLASTLAFDGRRLGGLSVSRITLVDGEEPNTLDLIVPLDAAYAARALARAPTSTLRGRAIRVLTPEDFVIFKILSTRELDLEDATSVVRGLGDDLEIASIEQEVEAVAEGVAPHPVRERWERIRAGA